MSDSARTWLAEILGTFTLVFIGGLSILAGGGGGTPAGLAVLSFGFGLALLGGLYAYGEVSGGHFNPAVSLAALIDRRIDFGTFAAYVVSQSGGAILGAVAILAASSQSAVASTATAPGGASTSGAFFLEIILRPQCVRHCLAQHRAVTLPKPMHRHPQRRLFHPESLRQLRTVLGIGVGREHVDRFLDLRHGTFHRRCHRLGVVQGSDDRGWRARARVAL